MMIVLTDQDLEEIVATAHMAGQQKAGVKTPTYYDAHLYYARQVKKLTIPRVSKRSELLIGLLEMLEKEGGNDFIDKAEIVAKYEANL
jgi:hypothetical protein